MAKINNIHFNNFRNFTDYKISFEKKLNILFGENGCGKTNILEGISLNSKGRGIRNSSISNLIKKKENSFLIKNNLEIKYNNFNVAITTENKNDKFKKIVKINDDMSKDSMNSSPRRVSCIGEIHCNYAVGRIT